MTTRESGGVVMHYGNKEWMKHWREAESLDNTLRFAARSALERSGGTMMTESLTPEEIKAAELMGNSLDSLRKFKRNEKVRTIPSSSDAERDLAKAFGFNSVEDYRQHYPSQTDWVEGDDRSFRAHLAKVELEAAAQWE